MRSWHRRIDSQELIEELKRVQGSLEWYVWVSVQPVILALHSCRLDAAAEAARLFANTGFKYTGFRFLPSSASYYITVIGTERLDIPIYVRGRQLIDYGKLELVVEVLNDYLSMAKHKLSLLERAASALKASLCPEDGREGRV